MNRSSFARSAASICALVGVLAHGQAPAAAAIPPAANTPYPGTLTLQVDASDIDGPWIMQSWVRWGVPAALIGLLLVLLLIANIARRRNRDKS